MPDVEPVLSIRNLVVEFKTDDGIVHAVDDISYDVFPGETLGIVGESGSGKSVSTLSITLVCLNAFGDGLRDALDPRMRR